MEMVKPGLTHEVVSLREWCDAVKLALEDKGYNVQDVRVGVDNSDEWREARTSICYDGVDGERTYECFAVEKVESFDTVIHDTIEWLDSLEDRDVAYRKSLLSKLDAVSTEMDYAGFEGAKAILDAIMEPMRTNLLTKQ